MVPTSCGWLDKTVRHTDGREGVISSEFVGFGFVQLTITCANGRPGHIQLNNNNGDSGDRGWEWYCENFAGGARFLPLGEFEDSDEKDLPENPGDEVPT